MLPAPMLVPSPTSASPMYERCGIFDLAPRWVFFISTYVPALAPSSMVTPGRRYANGPTWHPRPTVDDRTCALTTTESSPTRESLSLIHISEPTRRTPISYAVFCLKKKKNYKNKKKINKTNKKYY